MKRLLCLIAVAAVTTSAFAENARRAPRAESFASDFQTVPVMANANGANGAVFQTYVAILNPTSSAFPVEVSLYDSTGAKHDATINLNAGQIKTYQNFVAEVLNFTGGGAVTFKTANPANRFILAAEVWTSGTRYNTPIPPLEFPGSDSRSFAPGIYAGSTTRTNVGCFNQSANENNVTVTVKDATGALTLGTVSLKLPAHAWGQTSISSVVVDGYAQFDPTGAAVCYAVVVDNSTNDGRYVPAAEYRP